MEVVQIRRFYFESMEFLLLLGPPYTCEMKGGQHLPKHMGYKLGVSYGTYITYIEIHQLQKNR